MILVRSGFFDPDLKQYYKVPFADQGLPSMSVWEFIQAKERLKKNKALKMLMSMKFYELLQSLEIRLSKLNKKK